MTQHAPWGAVALWLELRALNRENPGLNPLAAVLKLWQFLSSHVATVHSAVKLSTWLQTEVDFGKNSLRAVIVA